MLKGPKAARSEFCISKSIFLKNGAPQLDMHLRGAIGVIFWFVVMYCCECFVHVVCRNRNRVVDVFCRLARGDNCYIFGLVVGVVIFWGVRLLMFVIMMVVM